MKIEYLHPRGAELCGYIPQFLSGEDSRPMREQLHSNYAHGGGVESFRRLHLRWKRHHSIS